MTVQDKQAGSTDNSSDNSSDSGPAQSGERKSGSVLALVLALLALVAAGFAGWQVYELRSISGQLSSETGTRVAQARTELSTRIDALEQAGQSRQQAVADLQGAVTQGMASLADLPARVEQLEAQIASVPGINNESRVGFLRAEAIYYMRIANAQVVLAREPLIAANALQLADDKLREIADPTLTRVREQLSAEVAALRAVPEIDRVGISFSLQSLATQAGNWPFRNGVPERFGAELPATDTQSGASIWQRLKAVLAGVFDSIVSVREVSAPPEAQLGTAERALVVESVRAELQLARLGIVSGNDELFRQSLQRVGQQARSYFDVSSSPLQAALETLAELEAVELPGPLPDISASLAMLLAAGPAAAPAAPAAGSAQP